MAAIPLISELVEALLEYRDTMRGGAQFVWVCCNEVTGQWSLIDDRKRLEGVYARVTIGVGDHVGIIAADAQAALDRIVKFIKARDEGEGYA